MSRAFIALGANLDKPKAQLERACEALAALPDTCILRRSQLYVSDPVGCAELQPAYLNAVVELATTLPAKPLLQAMHTIELQQGRIRSSRNAARTLDLDLLLYDEETYSEAEGFCVPHPRMQTRAFVLRPLFEIAPDITIPGAPALAELLLQVVDQVARPLPDSLQWSPVSP